MSKDVHACRQDALDEGLHIPLNVTVQVWKGSEDVERLVSAGHEVVVSNAEVWYLDCGRGVWVWVWVGVGGCIGEKVCCACVAACYDVCVHARARVLARVGVCVCVCDARVCRQLMVSRQWTSIGFWVDFIFFSIQQGRMAIRHRSSIISLALHESKSEAPRAEPNGN